MKGIKFKSDKFKKARGGYSRLLKIDCAKCGELLCFYQKDGPGILKRMYIDRMFGSKFSRLQNTKVNDLRQLICSNCKELIGVPMIYKKESRPAFRLFIGSVSKKIVDSKTVNQTA